MGVSQLKEESSPPDFLDSLNRFSKEHRAQRWEGTLGDFLTHILPTRPAAFTRTSHEYIWDMLLWHGRDARGRRCPEGPRALQARAVRRR